MDPSFEPSFVNRSRVLEFDENVEAKQPASTPQEQQIQAIIKIFGYALLGAAAVMATGIVGTFSWSAVAVIGVAGLIVLVAGRVFNFGPSESPSSPKPFSPEAKDLDKKKFLNSLVLNTKIKNWDDWYPKDSDDKDSALLEKIAQLGLTKESLLEELCRLDMSACRDYFLGKSNPKDGGSHNKTHRYEAVKKRNSLTRMKQVDAKLAKSLFRDHVHFSIQNYSYRGIVKDYGEEMKSFQTNEEIAHLFDRELNQLSPEKSDSYGKFRSRREKEILSHLPEGTLILVVKPAAVSFFNSSYCLKKGMFGFWLEYQDDCEQLKIEKKEVVGPILDWHIQNIDHNDSMRNYNSFLKMNRDPWDFLTDRQKSSLKAKFIEFRNGGMDFTHFDYLYPNEWEHLSFTPEEVESLLSKAIKNLVERKNWGYGHFRDNNKKAITGKHLPQKTLEEIIAPCAKGYLIHNVTLPYEDLSKKYEEECAAMGLDLSEIHQARLPVIAKDSQFDYATLEDYFSFEKVKTLESDLLKERFFQMRTTLWGVKKYDSIRAHLKLSNEELLNKYFNRSASLNDVKDTFGCWFAEGVFKENDFEPFFEAHQPENSLDYPGTHLIVAYEYMSKEKKESVNQKYAEALIQHAIKEEKPLPDCVNELRYGVTTQDIGPSISQKEFELIQRNRFQYNSSDDLWYHFKQRNGAEGFRYLTQEQKEIYQKQFTAHVEKENISAFDLYHNYKELILALGGEPEELCLKVCENDYTKYQNGELSEVDLKSRNLLLFTLDKLAELLTNDRQNNLS